jgi:hypothetical protein
VLPKAGISASILRRNFALAYGAKSVTDPRSELGFRTDKSFAMPDGVLTLRGATGTRHSPRPPGGGNLPKTRAHHAAGRELVSGAWICRHCARSEATKQSTLSFLLPTDCFASLAMTAGAL